MVAKSNSRNNLYNINISYLILIDNYKINLKVITEEKIDIHDEDEENPVDDKKLLRGCREYGHILVILSIVISVIIFIVYVALGGLSLHTV